MKKYTVEKEVLRMLPEMEKPTISPRNATNAWAISDFLGQDAEYNKVLASQPTIKRGDNGQWKEGDVKIEGVDFEFINCELCGGDGKETCSNPDHRFIEAIGGEVGRLGCPVCGHDDNHKVKNGGICDECNGTGKVAIPKQHESEETFTFSEDELYSIISRSQAHALKEDWLTPAEVLKKIKAEYRKGNLNNTTQ